MDGWYWIDTKWGCGGISVCNDYVMMGAPIFKKFIGQRLSKLAKVYRVVKV